MTLVPDGAPANVTARNLSSTEVFVEWDRLPEKYLHGVLLGYQMNLTRVATNVTEVVKILPNVTSHRFSGLVMYNCYVISIAAINEIGIGVVSQSVIVWTDEGGRFSVCFLHFHQNKEFSSNLLLIKSESYVKKLSARQTRLGQ